MATILQAFRRARTYSVKEMAQLIGASLARYKEIERFSMPTPTEAQRIADVLDVEQETLWCSIIEDIDTRDYNDWPEEE